MKFHPVEVPVATSMLELADQAQHPFQKYFCSWAAFNNIYTLIAKRLVENGLVQNGQDLVTGLVQRNGVVVFSQQDNWGYRFPKVTPTVEKRQISETVKQIDRATKHTLIGHPKVKFFLIRHPTGTHLEVDNDGKQINGVLNVTKTVDPQYPIWSPIDKQAYENYAEDNLAIQAILAEQIVFMLYTIRNNLVHGSKSRNEANDIDVVEAALPLLEIVVRSFIRH
jgi:hypothetical protein